MTENVCEISISFYLIELTKNIEVVAYNSNLHIAHLKAECLVLTLTSEFKV
jgi:hypothetical protein